MKNDSVTCGVLRLFVCLALCLTPGWSSSSPQELEIELADGNELFFSRYPATDSINAGNDLVIIFAPEYGLRPAHHRFAQLLSDQGVETWIGNLQESLFLPDSAATIRQLDPSPVTRLVDHACAKPGRRVVLAGDSYAAVIALKGAHHWQRHGKTNCLAGAALFSPYALNSIPPLGERPEYLPIINATNIPLLVYQTTDSAIYGEFTTLLEELGKHGSPIYSAVITDVMSLFYEDPASAKMTSAALQVVKLMVRTLPLLRNHQVPDLPPVLMAPAVNKSGIDVNLKRFNGQFGPRPIRLKDIEGTEYNLEDFRGQTTLVNFWATWCPPCVEEIPSLNALKKSLAGEAFELISVNYAEEDAVIREFMQSVAVDFTVLQDPDGEFARQWNVISYPSSFVIDSRGEIRYGVNAAIDWNDIEVVETLRMMTRE